MTGRHTQLGRESDWWPPLAFAGAYLVVALPVLLQSSPTRAVVAASLLLGGALSALSAIDCKTMRLPDMLTLPLAAAGIVLAAGFDWAPLWWRLLSACVGFVALFAVAALYRTVRGQNGLGLGDAKLFAAAGAWVGLEGLPSVLLYAAGSALAGILVAAVMGNEVTARTRFAFGPFLAFGLWLVWLYGPLT